MSNSAHISVLTQRRSSYPNWSLPCVASADVEIEPQRLQDYCATLLRPIEHDLVLLCGAIVFADRSVKRRRGSGWRRDLTLSIPVNALDVWQDARVVSALVDALDYVTGDDWRFEFVEGGEPVTTGQSAMPYDEGPYVVVPFSDGLDSFLQWQLLRHDEPDVTVLRVQMASRAIKQSRVRAIDRAAQNARDRQLRVPVTAHYGDHPEPTYRTRTFLFFCMAALAATKTGTRRVVVGENGVGALGPSLLPYGDECPHRTTHPAFTRRIATFINALLEAELSFVHPQLYRTKGQVLAQALRYGVTGWELTNSCVRDARAGIGDQSCGVCSGCLLRRTALLAAGLAESGFYWQDLSATTLATCRPDFRNENGLKNGEDIMRHAAHDMAELASMVRLDVHHRVIQAAAWELADGDLRRCYPIAGDIQRLIEAHAGEWEALRSMYGGAPLLALEAVR